ncbi:MAG: AAA family ATPase [Actinomycetota bacterium]|nr:AAA family ATPase [Actinomycetota bacterium]
MACPRCGVENRPDRRYCSRCGAPLVPVCDACGATNEHGDAYCGECGTALGGSALGGTGRPAETDPPPRGAMAAGSSPTSERRLVSALFVDLVGFTSLAEARDAEDVRDLLSRYFEVARATVERYGGTVEKFIGDAVMAVWGTPAANEDDAERAVRTALDLVASVGQLGHEIGMPSLSARAGVLTGEAAVNIGVAGQGMVAGDLVNTASRFQSAADAGTVLVGEATYVAARDAIAFAEVGRLDLKGKSEPVRAWRALRVVAKRRGVGRSEALEPPFVGRDDDLRLLVDLLHATGREGRSRLVSVTGTAGIGKSRLAWELQKYVDGLAETVYWHHGRSPAYGEGISFWALGEMVRMRVGITEVEDPTTARGRLASSVEILIADAEERHWVEPRLAHLLGLAAAPPGDRHELFSAWRTYFERIAELGTTVMVFEDLQWADAGLVDFVESLLEWSRNHPILVVTLSRPELAERRPTWGTAARNFSSLHLEPLSDEAMRALYRGLVPGLPEPAANLLVRRAEGVPLYAVETVRSLLDRGVLAAGDGAYELRGALTDLEIPETLHALVAARLDALAPELRSLVQDAAVLGKTFTLPLLSAIAGRDTDQVEQQLRDLVRKEILVLDSDPRSPERGQYGFVQSIIREVAYATLSKRDRRAKHLAAAHEYERRGDDELAGLVATHYLEAHRASSPGTDARTVAARARDWLRQASDRARSLGSSEQALAYAEQALEIATPGAERAGFLELAGETARLASEHERSVLYLEEAISFHGARGDAVAAGRATEKLTESMAIGLSRFAEANDRAQRAYEKLEGVTGADADLVRGKLAESVSTNFRLVGGHEDGLRWAETALAAAERLDDRELLLRGLNARAGCLFDLGRHREAAVLSQGASALADEVGSVRDQCMARLFGSLYIQDEDPRSAWRLATEGAELAARAGDRSMEILHLLNSAEMAIFLGEWETARRAVETVVARGTLTAHEAAWSKCCLAMLEGLTGGTGADTLLEQAGEHMLSSEFVAARTTFLRGRAVVRLAAGNLDGAVADAAAAVADDPHGINSADALVVQARAALWQADAAAAQQALAGMFNFTGRWMAAARLTVEAGIAALEGRPVGSARGFLAAAEAWRTLDMPFDRALCGVDAAVLLHESVGANGSEGEVGEGEVGKLVEEAAAILTRLGAAPLLERLERADSSIVGPTTGPRAGDR